MTRPVSRIKPILKLIEEAWTANPDLRLWQLLKNAGVDFHTEDLTWLVEALHETYWTTELLWGTRWKSWRSAVKYLKLEEIDSSHLVAILNTQKLDKKTYDILIWELAKRYIKWEAPNPKEVITNKPNYITVTIPEVNFKSYTYSLDPESVPF